MSQEINIKNRKATFQYEIIERYTAGLQLLGSEIKSLRDGRASIPEAFCYFKNDELFVKNMHINEYSHANINNHEPLRERKLLLNRKELNKLQKKINEKGLTIIPLRLFINKKGFAKMDIGLGKGKHHYDKREDIKKKDMDRAMKRSLKF